MLIVLQFTLNFGPYLKMFKPYNAAWSIFQMVSSLSVMSPPGFPQQLLKTFNVLLKVTKKITQRNFVEKLLKLDLPTGHAKFVTGRILSTNKSSLKSNPSYRLHILRSVMHMELQDAVQDVEETRNKAGLMIGETLTWARSLFDKHQLNILKSNFFRLVHQHREFLWHKQKMKNSNAIKFKRQKYGHLPVTQPQNQSFPGSERVCGRYKA